ncbi:hypothetical protein EVG20_g3153 [Dentipellis fragilis]|uniref:WD40 repeat-like protein n=1 Tax=Dentipellis fragilis TaxID=205917 RepID=A0A4Y9Z457_9AGAM|nr:hypothetical protein EVG20_g3153 [Dentipellis fragilis]
MSTSSLIPKNYALSRTHNPTNVTPKRSASPKHGSSSKKPRRSPAVKSPSPATLPQGGQSSATDPKEEDKDECIIERQWFPLPRLCAGVVVGSQAFCLLVNAKIHKVTESFSREGKRVIGLPRLEENGICFDIGNWNDASTKVNQNPPVKQEDVKPAFINNLMGGNTPADAIVIYDTDEEVVDTKEPVSPRRVLSQPVPAGSAQDVIARPVSGDNELPSPTPRGAVPDVDDSGAGVLAPDIRTPRDITSVPHHHAHRSVDTDNDRAARSMPARARKFRTAGPSLTSDSETSSGDWEDGELEYEALPTPTRLHKTNQRSPSPPSRGARHTEDQHANHETSRSGSAMSSKQAASANSNSVVDSKIVSIPAGRHKRARRLLVPENKTLPLMTVDLGSDFQFISRSEHFRISAYSMPCPASDFRTRRIVEDAVMIQNTAVVGYSKPARESFQIAIVPIVPNEPPLRTNLSRLAHTTVNESILAPAQRNRGISALAAVEGDDDAFKFVSGGFDGRIYLWSIQRRDGFDKPFRTRTEPCAMEHTSSVLSLAYRRSDGSLLSAAGKVLSNIPLKARARRNLSACASIPSTLARGTWTSCADGFCNQTDHLNHQIQLFDTREGGFDGNPAVQFGWRPHAADARLSVQSRHSRGSCSNTRFVRGFKDGVVKVWDIRKVTDAAVKLESRAKEAVFHTIFTGSHVAAYGAASVTFYKARS